MGLGHSAGHVYLHLLSRTAQAGSELSGVIYLKLNETVEASALCLKFNGTEQCQWPETRTESNLQGEMKTVTEIYKGENRIAHWKFPIFIFTEGLIEAGDYSFPFQFHVPSNIPGTFHLERGKKKASINYNLIALIEGASRKIEKSVMQVQIAQALTTPIHAVVSDVQAHITTWCFFKQGEVHLKANFSKNAYAPGEIAEIIVEVDNTNSRIAVSGIQGTLYRMLRLKSNTERTHASKDSINHTEIFQRVPSGESQSIRMNLSIPNSRGELRYLTSVRGKHIECMYSIVVHASMEGWCMCCGGTPEVEQVVVLYPPQLPGIQPPQAPSDWSPQLMPEKEVTVGEYYAYAN